MKTIQQKISVKLPKKNGHTYPIIIGVDIFEISSWLPTLFFQQIVIVTDSTVQKKYGQKLQQCLRRAGHHTFLFSFPAGEKNKTHQSKQLLENNMLSKQCNKETLILALGGGVVGDLAGYLAATFLRGIPYIQIPTTLLAMIDSSVGGKTGINTSQGKNLVGAIYQPLRVVADLSLLQSLPKKQMINGLVEAIKVFLTCDARSFYFFAKNVLSLLHGDPHALQAVIYKAVRIKAAVVSRDENEKGERNILNFGHTIGHALEKISNFALPHGYAVAYGILLEATISYLLGYLQKDELILIKDLLAQLGVKAKFLQNFDIAMILKATLHDKKSRSLKVHYILLKSIGKAYISKGSYTHVVNNNIVKKAFKNLIRE